jgi:hypothetical protein
MTIISASAASNEHMPLEGCLKKKKSLTDYGSSPRGLSNDRGSVQKNGRWNVGVPAEKRVMSCFVSEVAV